MTRIEVLAQGKVESTLIIAGDKLIEGTLPAEYSLADAHLQELTLETYLIAQTRQFPDRLRLVKTAVR